MKIAFYIAMFIMVAWIIGWIIAEWGKKGLAQALKYEEYYDSLQISIYDLVITKENYDKLIIRFERLGDMKGGNKERNQVLFVEFACRFRNVSTN